MSATNPNPYATPKAPVADAAGRPQGNFLPGGRAVPAGHGWDWIAEAWNLFKRQPGIWIVIAVLFIIIVLAMSFLRALGSVLAGLIAPALTLGMVLGAAALDEGKPLEVGHLFAGLRNRFGSVLAVGAIYVVLWLAISALSALAAGVSPWLFLGGNVDPSIAMEQGMRILLASLISLALMLPVFMAIWFAPTLVVFHGRGALEAMKESFSGCLKNVVPFLVYGLIGLVLGILASIPILLGWLVVLPMMAASIYTAYRDIYFTP